MKKNEIVVGGIYSNGKEGRFYSERKVIDIDSTGKYKLYDSQVENRTILYKTVKGHDQGEGKMTLTRFATWAKQRIS